MSSINRSLRSRCTAGSDGTSGNGICPRERIAAATAISVWVGCNSVACARATVLNQTWACSNLSHETYWPEQFESKQLRCATVPVTSTVFPDVKKPCVYQRSCPPSCTLFYCSCLLGVPRKNDVQISFVQNKCGLRACRMRKCQWECEG